MTNLFKTKYENTIGLAFATAFNSDEYKKAMDELEQVYDEAEIAVEITGQFYLLENLMIQPDFQYIINPDANPDIENALIGGLRIEIAM